MTDLTRCGSLGVGELQRSFQSGLQDTIFSGKTRYVAGEVRRGYTGDAQIPFFLCFQFFGHTGKAKLRDALLARLGKFSRRHTVAATTAVGFIDLLGC
jgi:hypothetical protein